MRAAACCLLCRLGSPWPSGPWAAGAAHIRLPRTSAATVRSRYGPANRCTQLQVGTRAGERSGACGAQRDWRQPRYPACEQRGCACCVPSLSPVRRSPCRHSPCRRSPCIARTALCRPLWLSSSVSGACSATGWGAAAAWTCQPRWSGSWCWMPTTWHQRAQPSGRWRRPAHCRGTSIALKPLPRRPDKRPGIAVMVCQEGGVRIGLVGANGEALRCRTEWVAKVSTGMDMTQRGSRA